MDLGLSDYRDNYRTTGMSDYWDVGLQELSDYWDVRLLGCRTTGMSDYWDAGLPGCLSSPIKYIFVGLL